MEEIIIKAMKEKLDKAYDEYKEAKLKDLEMELEMKRNKLVGDLINSIRINQKQGVIPGIYEIHIELR